MKWLEVKIFFNSKEEFCNLQGYLASLNIHEYVVDEPVDIDEIQSYWDYIDEDVLRRDKSSNITVYFADNEQHIAAYQTLKCLIEDKYRLTTNEIFEEDWENNWKEYFKPFNVGERYLIKPTWEDVKDTGGRIILEIDPESSFGTGGHETTKLCIEEIEKLDLSGRSLLDVGCGSGILSIAAGLIGADVTILDIDEHAINIALKNLKNNGISAKKHYIADISAQNPITDKFDFIVANIVASVIINIRYILHDMLKDNGVLVVSGIIKGSKDEVITYLTDAGFKVEYERNYGDWYMIKFFINM